jgi:hypothetical protein
MNKTGLLLMTLCLGLSGCVSGLNGQVRSQGTVTAVNASEQTVQIKTEEGQPLTVTLEATTVLRDGDRQIKTKATLDQISAGKYLVAQCSKSPEGKLIAVWAYVFNQRPANLRGASPTTSAATSTTASPTVSALGPSFKPGNTIPADKATIYIYRPGGFTGGLALPFGVKVNGKTLIILVQNGYYAYLTEPGQIEFTTFEVGFMAPSSVFSITVDARVQQAYYLKGAHGKGAGGRASLQLVSPEVGANEIANCKLISSP